MNEMEQKVLKTLSHQYKTQAAASTEIINLQSILNLPKGTEHFLTDIHGEYEQFNHVLKNGSGSVRRKIDEEFGNTISSKDKKSLATLIYYPESKLEIVEREEDNLEDWYKISLHRLVQVIKRGDLQGRGIKIHPLQSQKGIAEGFRLCHRRTDYGKGRNSG